jgi:hypothetical protein
MQNTNTTPTEKELMSCRVCGTLLTDMPESLLLEEKDAQAFESEGHQADICAQCANEVTPKQATVKEKALAHILRHANRFTQSFNVFGPELSIKEL